MDIECLECLPGLPMLKFFAIGFSLQAVVLRWLMRCPVLEVCQADKMSPAHVEQLKQHPSLLRMRVRDFRECRRCLSGVWKGKIV